MSLDDVRIRLRERPIRSDEVRKRRVLARVLERRQELPRRRLPWIVAAASAAIAITVVILVLVNAPTSEVRVVESKAVGGSAESSLHGSHPSTLDLDGIGRAVVVEQADIAIKAKNSRRLEVSQSRGTVRYEIDRPDGREVIVQARWASVRVVGTVFVVAIDESDLAVRVERGVVQVGYGERRIEIIAGEQITIAEPSIRDGRGQRIAAAASTSESPEEPGKRPGTVDDVAPPTSATRDGAGRSPREQEPAQLETPMSGPTFTEPEAGVSLESPTTTGTNVEIEGLLARVDEDRGRGDLAGASRLLVQIVREHPDDARSLNALFIMGKVERQRGNHTTAAEAFHRCYSLGPDSLLAEDALAESAVSWADAGRSELAKRNAKKYLSKYSNGTHATRMQQLLE